MMFSPNRTKQNTSIAGPEDFSFDLAQLPFRALYYYIMDVVAALFLPILVFGIIANILNIAVFTRTGARDNVTVSFLSLSASDLMYLVVISPFFTAVTIMHYVEQKQGTRFNWLVDKNVISIPFYWYSFVFYETSILITVYISVVRCACVAMPFTVKTTFTSRTAIITFITFFVSVILIRVPVFMTKRIILQLDPKSNSTRAVYKEFEDGGLAEKLHDILNRNILNWASIVMVIACLAVMVTKLRASVRFRCSLGATSPAIRDVDGNNERDRSPPLELRNQAARYKGKKLPSSEKGKQLILSSRETQVLRSVILVAAVFITCQAPLMAYTLARRFESQFDDTHETFRQIPKYSFLFALCSHLSSLFTLINASVNIIIHYNFNSRYRQAMKTILKLDRIWSVNIIFH